MKKFKQAAFGLIFNNDRDQVVLVKRKDIPVWVIPGGKIEDGEKIEDAALRESEEETGYKLKLVRKLAEYKPQNSLTELSHIFELKIIGGKPTLNDEAQEISFFSVKKLPKLLPPPYSNWILRAYNSTDLFFGEIFEVTYPVLIKFFILHPILVLKFLKLKLSRH